MPETASAPSLTVFQSAVMATVERMLRNLSQRVAGPQSVFGSRHQTFAERVLDRRLGTVGLEPWRLTSTPRPAAAQDWVFPRRWVPEPQQRPELVRPAAEAPAAAAAAVAPAVRRVPTPSLAERAPSLPLPPPPSAPTPPAGSAIPLARPTSVRQTEAPTAAAAPARPLVAPVAQTSASVAAGAPVATPSTAPADSRPTTATAAPSEMTAPSVAVPSDISTTAPAAVADEAAVSQAESVATSPSAPERVSHWLAQLGMPVARANRGGAPVVPSDVSTVQPGASTEQTAAPTAQARAPMGQPGSSTVRPGTPSALARSFGHLDWSDVQLGRAPESKRLLGNLLEAMPTVSPRPVPTAAMPMLTPEAPPTAAKASARPVATPTTVSVPPPAPLAVKPTATTPSSRSEATQPGQPAIAEHVPPTRELAATAAAPPATAPSARGVAAAGPAPQSLAMLPLYEAALLGAPIAPQLGALTGSASSSVRPASALLDAEPTLLTRQTTRRVAQNPGGLASFVEQFATQIGSQAPTAAAGPSGVLHAPRHWQTAPGLSHAVSSLLSVGRTPEPAAPQSFTPTAGAALAASLPAQTVYARMLGQSLPFLPPVEAPTRPGRLATAAGLTAPAPVAQPAIGPADLRPLPAEQAATPRSAVAAEPISPTAAAPWRGAGGLATLAELWSAGVALGSGAAASISAAATPHAGALGGLIPQWLPLAAQAAAEPKSSTTSAPFAPIWTAPSLSRPLEPTPATPSLVSTLQPEAARALPSTMISALLRAQPAAGPTPAVASVEPASGQAARAGFEPIFADALFPRREAQRPAETARQAGTIAPVAAAQEAPRPSAALPSAVFRSAGGLAALVEQFAAQKTAASDDAPGAAAPTSDFSQRRYAPFVGLPSVSMNSLGAPTAATTNPLLDWATAPGLSAAVQRWLAPPTPARRGTAFAELPFVPSESAPTATAARLSTNEAARRAALPVTAATATNLGSRAMVSPMPPAQPSSAASVTAPAAAGVATAASAAAAPWRSVGGLATLAELFAAGVGVGTGAASGAAEQYGIESTHGLVPSWLRPETRATATGTASAPRFESVWPEAPLPRATAATMGSMPLVAPAARPGAIAATPGARPPSFVTGSMAAAAEHFAVGHGLGMSPHTATTTQAAAERLPGVAPESTMAAAAAPAGRWIPVSGGMVFVPAERRPEAAMAGAATANGLRAGGLGLRSELLASGLPTAAAAAPSQLQKNLANLANLPTDEGSRPYGITPSTSTAAETASPARFGWTAAGGMVYLGRPVAPGVEKSTAQPTGLETAAATGGAQSFRLGELAGLAERFRGLTQQLAMPTTRSEAPRAETPAATNEAPRSVGGMVPLSFLFGPEPTATEAAPRRASSELSRQHAESLLTSFPKITAQAPNASDRQHEPATERAATLFPHAATETAARLTKLLAARPADWQPSATVAAAVKASGAAGMPLWQRLPTDLTRLLTTGPSTTQPGRQDGDDSDETGDSVNEMPLAAAFGRRPDLTVVAGGQAQRRPAPTPTPTPTQAPQAQQFPMTQRTQETALITSALKASGANSTQVEASVRLMEAIRSAGTSQLARSDDRLTLGDLTLIAISMGERKMAAASTKVVPGIPHVETALRLENQNQQVPEDDKTVRQKIEHLAKQVRKEMKSRKDAQKERGAVDM